MSIEHNIRLIRSKISGSAHACARDPESITLLAVSKGQSVENIHEAFKAGVCSFGENYLQEALIKQEALKHLPLHWHFIGPIQSNKTKAIANHFDCVHSVDREKVAVQLNTYRSDSLPPLDVFIQVNVDEEATKSGVAWEHVFDLATTILSLPKLHLCGLMAIPKNITDNDQAFARLHDFQSTLNKNLNLDLQQLSMGMTHDYQAAIREGSTLIRVGRGIFSLQETSFPLN